MNRTFYPIMLGMILILSGCGTIHHHVTFPQNKPIALGSDLGPGRQYALVHPFEETEREVYFFFHWFPINRANGIEAAEKHLHEGDGIVNLRIKTKFGPVDYLVSLITGGLFTTYTIETRGDVVKVPLPPPTL